MGKKRRGPSAASVLSVEHFGTQREHDQDDTNRLLLTDADRRRQRERERQVRAAQLQLHATRSGHADDNARATRARFGRSKTRSRLLPEHRHRFRSPPFVSWRNSRHANRRQRQGRRCWPRSQHISWMIDILRCSVPAGTLATARASASACSVRYKRGERACNWTGLNL